MHRLEHFLVAVEHHIDGTSALHNVTTDISDQTHVIVSIHEYLQIHHVTQLLVVQCHNTLKYNHRLWLHMNGLRQTVGDDIRIGRLFDSLAILQHLDMLRQQFPVEGIRMVKVNGFTLLIC